MLSKEYKRTQFNNDELKIFTYKHKKERVSANILLFVCEIIFVAPFSLIDKGEGIRSLFCSRFLVI